VFLQLACGVKHLHACGVLHRDLKSDNALISSTAPLVVKWADFGCSVKLDVRTAASTYGGSGGSSDGKFLLFVCHGQRVTRLFSTCRTCVRACVRVYTLLSVGRESGAYGVEGAHGVACPGDVRESGSGQHGVDGVGRVYAGVLLSGASHGLHSHAIRLAG
jgi:serine/threonine protein kinase